MAIFNRKPKPTRIARLDELQPMLDSGKPVLLDFFQVGCAPCQVMDGIMNELAREYGDSAHIVKVDVAKVPDAARTYAVRSTPTFVLMGRAPEKAKSKKARRAQTGPASQPGKVGQRWRSSGLVKKDQLQRLLESNGAQRVA
jgi:thiol-disulfide isomerase/thioredoxin